MALGTWGSLEGLWGWIQSASTYLTPLITRGDHDVPPVAPSAAKVREASGACPGGVATGAPAPGAARALAPGRLLGQCLT